MAKAVVLLSGGLDSQLAVRLLTGQGIDVLALHFLSVFNATPADGSRPAAERAAENLGVELEEIDITARQIELIKNPPHGLGSAANPCIDCHMMMLRIAARRMHEVGADFLATGEVLGQRPMSQRRHSIETIDRETGLAGLILRPLSAKALPATIPEREGLVERDLLEGIVGRTRTRQVWLARQLGLTDYPSPAGGCLLTDPGFGARVHDALEHEGLDVDGARLLKVGRHYRIADDAKAVVGRNEAENNLLEVLAREGDILIELADIPGPTTLLRGRTDDELVRLAAALTARVSKAKTAPFARLKLRHVPTKDEASFIEVAPADDATARRLSVN